MSEDRCLPCVEIEPAEPAVASVVWLHGLGADGYDFEPVAQMLQPMLPVPVRFVLPHAPKMPVTVNGGMRMPAWYDMLDFNHPRNVDWASVQASEVEVGKLLERERQRGITPERLFLAGFSQGGAVALRLALKREQALAGVLALSTYLLQNEGEDFPVDKANKRPLFMVHGEFDGVIPFALAEASRNTLRQQGFEVEWHAYPMAHAVCPEEIEAIAVWLAQRLEA